MQSFYDAIGNGNKDIQEEVLPRLISKVVETALHRPWSLGESLLWLRTHRPEAYLARYSLNEEELAFWEGRVTFIREMLGRQQLPFTKERVDECPAAYLCLMHEMLGDINAAAAGVSKIPVSFNLVPQADVTNGFMKVMIFSASNCLIRYDRFLG